MFLEQPGLGWAGTRSWYLVVVEGVHQGDEAAGLGLLVEVEEGDVPDEDGVEQPGQLQVVAGAQRLGSDTKGALLFRNSITFILYLYLAVPNQGNNVTKK